MHKYHYMWDVNIYSEIKLLERSFLNGIAIDISPYFSSSLQNYFGFKTVLNSAVLTHYGLRLSLYSFYPYYVQ